ncbi:MAG: right-handed parallel beta-helix repeat-containing protein, partial [Chloroflexota bacterium]|nr:right-handed parallel beta-helix repeat-containing protein [Chloroflexota bacterium]
QDNVVEGNRLYDNAKYGVEIIRFQPAEPLRDNVVRNNYIFDNGRNGVKLPNAVGTRVLTNTIANNGWEGAQAKYQYGVMIEGHSDGSAADNFLLGNQFVNNKTGGLILCHSGSQSITNTVVQHNTFITSSVAISNNVPYSVAATFNDWGVTGLPAIEDKIYHQADSSLVGEALYYDIVLDDDGGSPMADGASYATVTCALTGLLYPAGNAISFTTDLGALSAVTGTAGANGIVTTTITSLVTGTATITGATGMGGENSKSGVTQVTFIAPLPIITSLSPVSTTVGGAGFTLTVNGANFVSGSVVYWNGAVRATTFVSGAQLIAEIPASDLETVGVAVAVVTVVNPAPDGGVSNGLPFEVIEFVQEKPVFIYLPLVCRNATPYSHRLYLPLVSRSAAP